MAGVLRNRYERGIEQVVTRDNVEELIEEADTPKDPLVQADQILLWAGRQDHPDGLVDFTGQPQIATIDEMGAVVSEASLPTSRSAMARYFSELDEPVKAAVEATSSWYWLHDLLKRERVPLTLAHAKFVKAIAYAKVKTDAVDAMTLAQLHRV